MRTDDHVIRRSFFPSREQDVVACFGVDVTPVVQLSERLAEAEYVEERQRMSMPSSLPTGSSSASPPALDVSPPRPRPSTWEPSW